MHVVITKMCKFRTCPQETLKLGQAAKPRERWSGVLIRKDGDQQGLELRASSRSMHWSGQEIHLWEVGHHGNLGKKKRVDFSSCSQKLALHITGKRRPVMSHVPTQAAWVRSHALWSLGEVASQPVLGGAAWGSFPPASWFAGMEGRHGTVHRHLLLGMDAN